MYNAKDFGALGDGSTLDSQAIQKAIDTCFAAGGGTVYIPEGQYLCGTMHLKTNVHVCLDKGALILGSQNREDFDPYEENPTNSEFQDRSHSYFYHSLFHADGADDIALTGYAALSVDKQTTFLTPASMAAVRTFSVPKTLVLTASMGKNSHDGTCFNAAAWNI